MSCLYYKNNELYIEEVSLQEIAVQFGTPCYVYSKAAILNNWNTFNGAFNSIPHRICYAVKANSNIAILRLLANLQSGFDVVSYGEIKRVIAAGGDTRKIVFSGVGKTHTEIEQGIQHNIYCFNVESLPELYRINDIATQMKKTVDIALRINPNINPNTHAHITTGLNESKFGIDISEMLALQEKILTLPSLRLIGIACHIGSQIVELQPFLEVVDKMIEIYKQLQDAHVSIQHINIGGGLGIVYHDEHPPGIREYAKVLCEKLRAYDVEIIIEPGRAIVGNAGVLLSRIEYIKETPNKNFAILDAGMNDLLRPALYDAWQTILPVISRSGERKTYDIAGPVCESADFIGKNRELVLEQGDLLAIDSAGAYGFSMSSNYNSRVRPPEVLVDGDKVSLIRRRERVEELFKAEEVYR